VVYVGRGTTSQAHVDLIPRSITKAFNTTPPPLLASILPKVMPLSGMFFCTVQSWCLEIMRGSVSMIPFPKASARSYDVGSCSVRQIPFPNGTSAAFEWLD
jgi:hypothetical protein